MRHNFDEIINRRVSECKKYEAACYPEDVLPMWIADTDLFRRMRSGFICRELHIRKKNKGKSG